MKKPTMLEIANQRSFEDIYAEIAQNKILLDTTNKDIRGLEQNANKLRSKINHLNQIALKKRRKLIEKE